MPAGANKLMFNLGPILAFGPVFALFAVVPAVVVERQLRAVFDDLSEAEAETVLIAYEPVWAIGTGKTATPGDASAVHAVIRQELLTLAPAAGDTVPILYGGSVNPGNAASLLAAPDVGGLLVGGASLDVAGWLAIAST